MAKAPIIETPKITIGGSGTTTGTNVAKGASSTMTATVGGVDKFLNAGETTSNLTSTAAFMLQTPTEKQALAEATRKAAAAKKAAAKKGVAETVTATEVVADGAKASTGIWGGVKGVWGGFRKIVGPIARRLAMPFMAIAGAFQTVKAVKKKDGHGAAQAIGGTAGTMGGMVAADALAIVATDAAVGSIGGPVGTAVGFVAGLVVAAGTMIFGGWAGSKVADKVGGNALHSALNKGTPAPVVAPQAAGENLAMNDATPSYRARIMEERQKAVVPTPAGQTR